MQLGGVLPINKMIEELLGFKVAGGKFDEGGGFSPRGSTWWTLPHCNAAMFGSEPLAITELALRSRRLHNPNCMPLDCASGSCRQVEQQR